MAKINKQILGKVQGALGDVTFRQRNGKSYISTRPVSFMPGSDVKSVARRDKFALSIKLASAINAVPDLKSIWDKNTPAGSSTFNSIMRTNYKIIGSENDLSGMVKLTPSLGFSVANPLVTYDPLEIKVNLDALGTTTGINVVNEPNLKLASVIYLSNPTDTTLSKHAFITFISGTLPADLITALEFTFAVDDINSQMLAAYQNHKVLFAVLTLNTAGEVIHYSNTFVG